VGDHKLTEKKESMLQELIASLPRQENLEIALNLARKELMQLEPERQADICSVDFSGSTAGGAFTFKSLGRKVEVSMPGGTVSIDGEQPSPHEQILIMHYLIGGKRLQLEDSLVTFKQIPDGRFYEEPFNRRVKYPLVSTFGQQAALLGRVGAELGGQPGEQGDVSVVLPVFPEVPITYVIWEGDDELPPEGTIIFRGDITKYFTAEDVVMAASLPLYRMLGAAAGMKNN
jgi:Domain of unknown function (DUF3786)